MTSSTARHAYLDWVRGVAVGTVAGVVIGGVRPFDFAQGGRPERARRLQVALAMAGALVVWMAHQASFLPPVDARSQYWTTSASFFFLRAGLLTLLLPLGYTWAHAPLRRKVSSWSPLEEMGRASLFVYWIHVEMVYGFFSRPIRRSLSLEGGARGLSAFHSLSPRAGAAEELARGGEGHLSN